MRGLNRLLISVVVTTGLVGFGLPASANSAGRPLERSIAGDEWSPPRQVPVPGHDIGVLATAISDQGQIAVAYEVGFRRNIDEGNVPGYVIVRRPGGVWGTPHRLNPRNTVIHNVELAFDAEGDLTAFWSVWLGPPSPPRRSPPPVRYAVATKSVHRAWSSHVRAGPTQHEELMWDDPIVLSVAPSGAAVIGWRQFLRPGGGFQFTVRVRPTADGPWGPAQALSSYSPRSGRSLAGQDVAISNDGTAIAAWMACPPWPALRRCEVQRSTRSRSRAWTAPATIATDAFRYSYLEVESTPAGFTAIKWRRRHNGKSWTVVALRTPGGDWSRERRGGDHISLAVGPRGTVAMAKGVVSSGGGIWFRALRLTWRTNRSHWTTDRLSTRRMQAFPIEAAVDGSGRVFVSWFQIRPTAPGEPDQERGFMSTHRRGAWRTTMLWDWTPHAIFGPTAVSSTGRAVAIWTVLNTQEGRIKAVVMRVLHPG